MLDRLRASAGLRWSLLLSFALGWRLLFFVGPTGTSDGPYEAAARAVWGGTYIPSWDPFLLRFGFAGVISLSFHLLGPGPVSFVLPNLVASLVGIVALFFLARRMADERTAWISAVVAAVFPLDVLHATHATPDLVVSTMISLSLLLVMRGEDRGDWRLPLFAGILLGLAHTVKETAVLGLFLLLVFPGRRGPRFVRCLGGFLAIYALEAVFFAVSTGDPFYRIRCGRQFQTGIAGTEYPTGAALIGRLFWELPSMLLSPADSQWAHFLLHPWLALLGAWRALRLRDSGMRRAVVWGGVLVLLVNCFPSSIMPFRPALPVRGYVRYLLVLGPPLCLFAGYAIARMERRRVAALALLIALSGLATFVLHRDERSHYAEAAEMAYKQLPAGLPVVADVNLLPLLRLQDGYRHLDRWKQDVEAPSRPFLLVVHTSGGLGGDWAAEWSSTPAATLLFEGEIPGRRRIRGRLGVGDDRKPGQRVRVFRVGE